MKKLIIIVNIFLFANVINAQQPQPIFTNNPFPKTITVSGSAEMEIIPDEIYVNITLREYQKKGETKKEIEAIKTAFLESCKAVGLPDSAVSIFAFSGYNNYYYFKKRKRDPDMQSSITYQVKFKDSKTMDDLVEKLDDEATQNFIIANTSHSKITEYRRQLKMKAIQAAKDKGVYLTESIGEKLGEAITIREPDEPKITPYYAAANSQIRIRGVNTPAGDNFGYNDKAQEIDFKKIKLRFEVDVVFALK
jgi:uncharacterized protein YggE